MRMHTILVYPGHYVYESRVARFRYVALQHLYLKHLYNLPIRPINFPFPEFQAAYRAQFLTLAVAEYPPGPLTGVLADAGFGYY